MKPILGSTDAGPLAIDVERLVSTRMLLTANSGAGKSWALRRLLEQTHGKLQHLVIDPEGEFFTLREKFDYVLAGRGGDCPAEPRSAALLAHRLLELGVSAVLDLYELAPRDRVRFVKVFLEALIDAPRTLWHPALVVIDEAHTFAPESGHGSAESLEAVARLMSQGRKRGFAGVLASQRLSKLAKDVAAEANNLLIGRAALDVDLNRAGEALGIAKQDRSKMLRSLAAGHFYAFGPALSETVVEVHVGEVATSHPRAGQKATAAPPAREKVRAALAQLADLPKEAEQELRTAADLKARVRELEAGLRAAEKVHPIPAPKVETKTVEVPVVSEAMVKRLEAVVDRAEKAAAKADETRGSLMVELNSLRVALARAQSKAPAAPPRRENAPAPAPRAAAPLPRRDSATAASSGDASVGSGGLRRILITLAQRPGLTNRQIGLRATLSSKSGTFSTYISRARSQGWIEDRGDQRYITQAGVDALGSFEPLPTGQALLEHWLRELGGGGAGRILQALADTYPASLSKQELGERADISHASGTFSTYLSRLRTLELVTGGRGEIRASEELFS